jgi:hypothetical protein
MTTGRRKPMRGAAALAAGAVALCLVTPAGTAGAAGTHIKTAVLTATQDYLLEIDAIRGESADRAGKLVASDGAILLDAEVQGYDLKEAKKV